MTTSLSRLSRRLWKAMVFGSAGLYVELTDFAVPAGASCHFSTNTVRDFRFSENSRETRVSPRRFSIHHLASFRRISEGN